MEESSVTLSELGLEPLMVDATVKRQREMGVIGKEDAVRATLKGGRAEMLTAISKSAKDRQ
jgi:D-arabinose 5-phosphate isomerase GutQ